MKKAGKHFLILFCVLAVITVSPVLAAVVVTNTTDGLYLVQTFTWSGAGVNITNWTVPAGVTEVRLFMVGGGGAGCVGGGGGGNTTEVLAIAVVPGNVWNLTVGVRGVAVLASSGAAGSYSMFWLGGTSYSAPGGTGAPYGAGNAGSGGSGGGGGAGAANGGAGGTNGTAGTGSTYPPGSGQGTTTESDISGLLTRYAGAGGGVCNLGRTPGTGGLGGGGNGTALGAGRGQFGTDNLGGGGGGGGTSDYWGGDGGNGIVILRYVSPIPTPTILPLPNLPSDYAQNPVRAFVEGNLWWLFLLLLAVVIWRRN